MTAKPGDNVHIQTVDEELEGILLPSNEYEKEVLVLKLESGYNIGIDKSKIKKVKIFETPTDKKIAAKSVKQNTTLPKISILHTGGTIASKVDYKSGGVKSQFSANEMLELFPELSNIGNISSRQITKMQSEMMRFAHYNIMAEEIAVEVAKGAQGIIIAHGTDTLHYSSAAMALMLQNLSIPVILVGSQRSSDRGSTDAALNLIGAAFYIANSKFYGVAICMHESMSDTSCLILPALKTRKMHTSRRDAFRPINSNAIARVNYEEKKVTEMLKLDEHQKGKFTITKIKDDIKIAIIKTHTNMYASQFLAYKGFDGLILEGTGMGHIPNEAIDEYSVEHKKIQNSIKTLIDSGTIVAMASQAIYGRIQMNVYTPQRQLRQIGVLGHLLDMTAETAFIKLAWLLSNYPKEKAIELYGQNLKGEITQRTEANQFLN